MDDADAGQAAENAYSRQPSAEDLARLCESLNRTGARYLVIGGFAMRAAGYDRTTMDVDLLVDVSEDNEGRIFEALRCLPDQAVNELDKGDIGRYPVVRVADEILVDLMTSACGVTFQDAVGEAEFHSLFGVSIPFASPALLWRTKKPTHREKDLPDLLFLQQWFSQRGQSPPPV